MFTVKHETPNWTYFHEAAEVSYCRAGADFGEHVRIDAEAGGPPRIIDSGVVFVMNDHGKTVQIYRMNAAMSGLPPVVGYAGKKHEAA
jgi:hypothetical protein